MYLQTRLQLAQTPKLFKLRDNSVMYATDQGAPVVLGEADNVVEERAEDDVEGCGVGQAAAQGSRGARACKCGQETTNTFPYLCSIGAASSSTPTLKYPPRLITLEPAESQAVPLLRIHSMPDLGVT